MDEVCGLPSGGSVRITARALPREGAPPDLPPRVVATEPAVELIHELVGRHGPVMFHQSGGCCDGSSPMCYPEGEFRTGGSDVLLGTIDANAGAEAGAEPVPPVEVWMSKAQFEYWSHTHLTIDVVKGRGAGFSLEAPEGVRFLIRSRLFTDGELAALA